MSPMSPDAKAVALRMLGIGGRRRRCSRLDASERGLATASSSSRQPSPTEFRAGNHRAIFDAAAFVPADGANSTSRSCGTPLTTLLLEPSAPRVGAVAGLAAALTAAGEQASTRSLGSTMGDNTISVFVLAALVLLLVEIGSSSRMGRVRWAGLVLQREQGSAGELRGHDRAHVGHAERLSGALLFPSPKPSCACRVGNQRTLIWDRLRERISRTRPDHLFFLETATHVDVGEGAVRVASSASRSTCDSVKLGGPWQRPGHPGTSHLRPSHSDEY